MYIDTHAHLYDERLMADEGLIPRALAAGVLKMMLPNCDSSTLQPMLDCEARWPQHCLPMMGLHPTSVKEDYLQELALVEEWLPKHKFYGVGECGLDYYWDKTYQKEQKIAFERQIELAIAYKLPVIIHSRESNPDCIDMVRKMQKGGLTGIFHCFSGTVDQAKAVIDLGLYLGIGGVVTYKNSLMAQVVQSAPLQMMVLETDAPYLTPLPHRGKRNESSYIPLIAAKVAELKGVDISEVAKVTTANAEIIFGIR